jgi:hypothetical protein
MAIVVLWGGVLGGGALALVGGGDSAGAAPAAAPVVVSSALPEWLAPGAPLRVAGSTAPGERVALVVAGRVVARVTAGSGGRFRIAAAAPRSGRHRVLVRTAARVVRVGVLRVRPVRLAAVGDVMFSESVAAGIAERGAADPWTGAGPLLRAADVATANLETAVSTHGAPVAGKEFTFRGAPETLSGMAEAGGIDVVSVANNHSLDYGSEAFLDTLRHVRAAGVAAVGGGATEAAAREPVVLRRGGLRIAFLAYSDVNPPGFPAGHGTPGTASAVTEHVTADVRAARRNADVVVCWFHWGEELRAEPTAEQRVMAAAALHGGAHVVLGAHPHVLGRVSVPQRGALVAWSLGNFVFPSFRAETVRTGVLVVRLGASGVLGHDLVPHRTDGYRPVPVVAVHKPRIALHPQYAGEVHMQPRPKGRARGGDNPQPYRSPEPVRTRPGV